MKFASRSPRERRGLLASLGRMMTVLAFAGLAACVLVHRQVGAQADEVLLSLGSRALALPGEPTPEARRLRINGANVFFRTQLVEVALAEAVHHYRRSCAGSGEDRHDIGYLIGSLATRSRISKGAGYVACLDTGARDFATLAARLTQFAKSWDLAAAGRLRYAYLQQAERPDATFILTMWAEGSVDLRGLLPLGAGDAQGFDLANVPRPPSSQRVLSVAEVSEPSGVYVYSAPAISVSGAERFYRDTLSSRGWRLLERWPGESLEIDGTRVVFGESDGRTLAVLAWIGDSGTTTVTLLITETPS